MAADVSTLVRLPTQCDGGVEEGSSRGDLAATDVPGGCGAGSGGVTTSAVPSDDGEKRIQIVDLNLPPPLGSSSPPPPVRPASPETSAGMLGSRPPSLSPPLPAGCQSVCTLEKVKSALERADRESRLRRRRQLGGGQAGSASPTSSSTTTSSAKRRRGGGADDGEEETRPRPEGTPGVADGDGGAAAEMAAAGCPSCLTYVLISRSNPRCPRCRSSLPLPLPGPPWTPEAAGKKAATIDLNADAAWSSAATTAATFF